MLKVLGWCRVLAVGVSLWGCGGRGLEGTAEARAVARPALTGAAASREALLDDFLAALRVQDTEALRRLRVTEQEYKAILLPGSVDEGKPLRAYPPEAADVAWGLLDTRSRHHERRLLGDFGGHAFAVEETAFEAGVKRYANHVAHKRLRLVLRDEADGTTRRLATGSVVEIGGRYKFVSFISD